LVELHDDWIVDLISAIVVGKNQTSLNYSDSDTEVQIEEVEKV